MTSRADIPAANPDVREVVLAARNVAKSYGAVHALKGVNFDNSLASDLKKAAGAVESIARTVTAEDKQGELKAKEPLEKVIHSAVGLTEAVSVLVGAGEYGTAARMGGYFFDFFDAAHDDEVETEEKAKRRDRRELREAREGD